jgi:cobalt-zinc-cadmium efflux system protein
MEPQAHYVKCNNQVETYRMFYSSWGIQEHCHSTLLCLHGLNRNSRDWDFIAEYFSQLGYFVVAPDIIGRGNSDYLKDPSGYTIANYVTDTMTLINTLKLSNINIIGTSMGGIITLSILPLITHLVKKIVLNDIGIEINQVGLERIMSYSTAAQPEFNTFSEAKQFVTTTSREFGALPDYIWEHMTKHSFCVNQNSRYELKRDPKITINFSSEIKRNNHDLLWQLWQQLNLPCFIIRGAESDLLSPATVEKMCSVNPHSNFIEIPNAGHAPFLYNENHFNILHNFLQGE